MVEHQSQREKPTSKIKTFRDLIAWQKSYKLALNVYRATSAFPEEERFGLATQMRRAVSSVPANIAEGFGRQGRKELIQFLQIAQGSLLELETHIQLAADLKYLKNSTTDLNDSAAEAERVLSALIHSLKQKGKSGKSP